MDVLEKQIAEQFPILQKELIAEMVAVSEIRKFQPGEVLMRTGQYIKSTLLVLDGLIKIYREDDEGNEFFMYYIDAGKACAISLLCAHKQDTSEVKAKAVTEATVISIPFNVVDRWISKYKSWNQFALSSYRERFEELLQTLDHTAFRNMDERLVYYLKRHQEKLQSNKLTITITEIAQELNSSREVISRLLRKLSEKGVIVLHRSYIEIVDLNKVLT
jgi:CRP/FNR family transcriptional regulator, anaerobic regulatory protein